jgi:RES domain-containing protein
MSHDPCIPLEELSDYLGLSSVGYVPGWNAADQIASRAFGDDWLKSGRSLSLLVPNLATQGVERNMLINRLHLDFSRIIMSNPKEMNWDARLFYDERTVSR